MESASIYDSKYYKKNLFVHNWQSIKSYLKNAGNFQVLVIVTY